MDEDSTFNEQKNKDNSLIETQRRGLETYGLRKQDVHTPHFGEHTLYGIQELVDQGRAGNNREAFEMLERLNHYQIEGIVFLDLDREQVQSENFGQHTLDGIENLVREQRALNGSHAFQTLEGLNVDQIRGIVDYALDREQVQSENFGEHTLDGIANWEGMGESDPDSNALFQDAFRVFEGLRAHQVDGILYYGLNSENVTTPTFDEHTYNGIQELVDQGRAGNYREAFEMLEGLNNNQIRGIVDYDLNREHVQSENFGEHTLNAILHMSYLAEQNNDIRFTNQNAFRVFEGLDTYQVDGMLQYNLNREQVQSENFGAHTLEAMANWEAFEQPNRNSDVIYQEAFKKLVGLNANQVKGIDLHGLDREQVQTPFYGIHTDYGIENLIYQGRVDDAAEAFEMLKGLNDFQTSAIVDYYLDRKQVIAADFKKIDLQVMEILLAANPEADGQNLYAMIRQMSEYQLRALAVNGFDPEHVAIAMDGDNFVLDDSKGNGISGAIVDAQSHLEEVEHLSPDDAYASALRLDNTQIMGMTEFGLSLNQVESSYFVDTNQVLVELINTVNHGKQEGGLELNIPIEEGQRQLVRETFDEMRSRYEMDHDIAKTSEDLMKDMIAVTGVASLPVQAERAAAPIRVEQKKNIRQDIEDDRKPAAKETHELKKKGEGEDTQGHTVQENSSSYGMGVESSQENMSQTTFISLLDDLSKRPVQSNLFKRPMQIKKHSDAKKYKKPKR